MKKNRGLLIAIYGNSGLDENTESSLFFRAFKKISGKKPDDIKIEKVVYPRQDILSSKPIEKYLNGNQDRVRPLDFQTFLSGNKREFEHPGLLKMLAENDTIIVKGYTGTSMAYGMSDGIGKNQLINFQAGLLEPEISIFFSNENFNKDSEENLAYKIDAERFKKMHSAYRELSKDLGWTIIDAKENLHDVSGVFILSKALEEKKRLVLA